MRTEERLRKLASRIKAAQGYGQSKGEIQITVRGDREAEIEVRGPDHRWRHYEVDIRMDPSGEPEFRGDLGHIFEPILRDALEDLWVAREEQ